MWWRGEDRLHQGPLLIDEVGWEPRFPHATGGGFLGLNTRHVLIPIEAVRTVAGGFVTIELITQRRGSGVRRIPYSPAARRITRSNSLYQKRSFSGYQSFHACGGRWRGCFLSQKPFHNQCSDTPPMSSGFETRFPRAAPAFFPRASTLRGRRGGSLDPVHRFSMCVHTSTAAR